MRRLRLLTLLLVALACSACCIDVRDEFRALRQVTAVHMAATIPDPTFDANGDGVPDDPAETAAKVARLEQERERLLDELEGALE